MDTQTQPYTPKQLRLKGVPKNVYDVLLEAQAEHKKHYNCCFSLEQTVHFLIKKLKNNGTARNT